MNLLITQLLYLYNSTNQNVLYSLISISLTYSLIIISLTITENDETHLHQIKFRNGEILSPLRLFTPCKHVNL